MNFRNINTTEGRGSLHVPARNSKGELGYIADKNGVLRALMVMPEVYSVLKRPLTASLDDSPKKSLALAKQMLESGVAQLSALPYDEKQEERIVGNNKFNFNPSPHLLKAANSVQPYETDWQTIDRRIREEDSRTEDNEYNFFQSIGLIENSLMWNDWQIKNIIAQPMEKRNNKRYAFNDMVPQAQKHPFDDTRYGEKTTQVPVNYNTMIQGSRVGSSAIDMMTASRAARSTQLQRNFDLLFGNGGIDLANPGTYWKGILNHSQTETFTNTLGGLYPGGKFFNNATDIEDVIKFVRRHFVANGKYGEFAALFGFDISVELATTIADNKTDSFTLGQVLRNITAELSEGGTQTPMRWGVSHKLAGDEAVFFINTPDYLQIKSGGSLNAFQLQGNNQLGTETFVYSMETLVAVGDGIDGNITIIRITGLLP
jgi:hypothetical protein